MAATLGLLLAPAACGWMPDWANPFSSSDDELAYPPAQPADQPQSYPNLATVPPAPTNALSASDRRKLASSLEADRQNAQYVQNSDEQYTAVAPKTPAPEAVLAAPTGARPAPSQTPVAPTPVPVQQSATPARVPAAPTQQAKAQGVAQRPAAQSGASTPIASGARPPNQAPVAITVAMLEFAPGGTKLSEASLERIREVAGIHAKNGGMVRVIGYSGAGADQGLGLERARVVGAALAKNGVERNTLKIVAGAPPLGQRGGTVEIALEY